MKFAKKDVWCAALTNRSHKCGKMSYAEVGYFGRELPDYIATFPDVGEYRKTSLTAASFFTDDYRFDGRDGLYEAVRCHDQRLLERYRARFADCRFVIPPDYSCYSNMQPYKQIFNIGRSREMFLFMKLEWKLEVIPFAGWGSRESLEYCFDGIMEGSVVAISLKGVFKKGINSERVILAKEAIKRLVDQVRPRAIVVYSASARETTFSVVEYAANIGVEVVVPSNRLYERNQMRRAE